MTYRIACPVCAQVHDAGTEAACCIEVHSECMLCRVAQQKFIDTSAIAEKQTAYLLAQMTPVNPGPARKMQTRTFQVTVMCSKALPELTDTIGGRIWSLDGVEDVTVTEQLKRTKNED